jgi:hypothetical protein
LRFVELRHPEDGQLVVLRGVGLRTRDDVRARGEALSLIAQIVSEHVERKARPIRVHSMPHDVYRLVSLQDLILAEGVQAWDEGVRRPDRLVRLLNRRYDLVINVHNYIAGGDCEGDTSVP